MTTPGILLAGGRSASVWSPLDIAGLVAWWDASDTSTITVSSGTNIATWVDKSGNMRTLTPLNGNPTTGRTVNGRNAVDFSGSNSLSDGNQFLYGIGSMSAFCAFGVDSDPTQSVRTLFAETDTVTSGGPSRIALGYTSTQTQAYLNSAGINRYSVLTGDPTNGSPHMISWTDSETLASISLDGGTAVTQAYTRTGDTNDTFVVGRLYINAVNVERYHDGWIGDIIIYNTVLSAGNITLVEDYLSNKWGI